MKRVYIVPNRFVDSVTLMGVAIKLTDMPGIIGAECGMGTKQNIEMLEGEGYLVPDSAVKNDLILAINAEDEDVISAAYQAAIGALSSGSGQQKRAYHDIDSMEKGEFDVVQISLPGQYVFDEAVKAIDKGMDVFIFSADVSLERERELKEYGRDRDCLVMGPDAGVGLLGGVALAAGSIVRYGPIGIVGASGSGSQEVACMIEELGCGVTCILGTGGRDLKKKVGGISMKESMKRLEMDNNTKLICLVSMLADREVMDEVLFEADALSKPVVAVFLGADEELYKSHRVTGTSNLQDAAKACVRIVTGKEPVIGWSEDELSYIANKKAAQITGKKKYFRGLYTGGTFAEETLLTFRSMAPDIEVFTNRDNPKYAARLKTHKKSEKNTILDMGDLDFTAEAPHTVFDPVQRLNRFKQELSEPDVGLIAMDIILGPGVAPDPASCYLSLMKEHKDIVFICSVCGGEGDPQNKQGIRNKLEKAGAIVADSNYESARLCVKICLALEV